MTVVKCDKHPANYCVIFYDSEVLSVFNFCCGCLRLTRVVRHQVDSYFLQKEAA